MEAKSLMDVIAISDMQKDKNGKEFRRITLANPAFKTVVDEQTGDVRTVVQPMLKSTTNAYEESYLDGTKDWLANAKEGMAVEGRIERRPVEQYEFTARDGSVRIANTYTCVVFGDTTAENWEDRVKAAFRRNNHPVLGDVSAETQPQSGKIDITASASKKKAAVTEF